MNDFKKYKNFGNDEIYFKTLYKDNSNIPTLEFVMSFPDKDIWGDDLCAIFGGKKIYHKEILMSRDDWSINKNYSDYSKAIIDFDKAIEEFKSYKKWQEYKNEVNIYFFKQADEIINNLNGKL